MGQITGRLACIPFPGTLTAFEQLGKREGYINVEVWVTTRAVQWLQDFSYFGCIPILTSFYHI